MPERERWLLSLGQPAQEWLTAFPIGNGRMGAMVFGGTERERLALNHENLWRGVTRDRTTEPKAQFLPEIRQQLLAGEWVAGAELATKHLSGHDRRVQPYQPVGDLVLESPGHGAATGYRRELDLATGLCTVTYRADGVAYRREVFASAEHGVIALRLAADRPGAVAVTVRLLRQEDPDCTLSPWAQGSRLGLAGHFPEGVSFAAEARVLARGGRVSTGEGAALQVAGADELLLLLAIATDYREPDPAGQCSRHLEGVPPDWQALLQAHAAEHRALFERVSLEVGHDRKAEALPLDARLARVREGQDDPGLVPLYFQFGRYLLMSSSRRCDQPANLQGIWNESLRPPWNADFHHDVNLQMNYWPAESCHLAECAQPLFAYLRRAVPQGRRAARDLYGCRGIFLPIQTDVWDRATPEAPGWDVWIGAAAWLAQHLWWRYEHHRDEPFLREVAYPFLREVASFYQDYLVRDGQGRLVPVPSQSPENSFVGGATPVSLCVGATMDLLLIREVLERGLQASELLGVDRELRPGWEAILRDLPPFQLGRHGQLQEWLEDFAEAEPGHRHYSHLIGVFPGEQMTPERLPELFQAARVSLERRLASGGGHTGWSRAWTAALWARFGEGGLAYEHLVHLVTDFATDSLLDLHPPRIFQIDGNLGGTAAVAEMLLQSQGGVIRLLPALPPQWPRGRVRGLVARGGFVLELTWERGRLTRAGLTSERGGDCRIAWPGPCRVSAKAGPVAFTRDWHGWPVIPTTRGQTIVFEPES